MGMDVVIMDMAIDAGNQGCDGLWATSQQSAQHTLASFHHCEEQCILAHTYHYHSAEAVP